MFTWGPKYLFGVAAFSLLGAALYGLVTGGGAIGVISAGYKGGVGEHTGYTILVALAIVTGTLGVLLTMTRDGDAVAASDRVGTDAVLSVSTPRTASFWGPLAAFGVACMVVGLAVSQAFVILGIAVLAVVTLNWLVLAWSDRATGDDEVNAVLRGRLLGPFEIPMLALLAIAVMVIAVSRVLLAVSAEGATAVASVVAALIFGIGVAMAKSSPSRSIISGVVAVGALAVLAGGIAGAVIGEREIVHHDEHGEHGDDHGEGDDHSEEGEGE
ncbi:MAG: hypothetical protein AAF467_05335 [Actinomycetota bacterium]